MGLITKEVEIKLSNLNCKYYEDLGYDIPKHKTNDYWRHSDGYAYSIGEYISVKVEDLKPHSKVMIEYECDCCHKKYTRKFCSNIKSNYTFCTDCLNNYDKEEYEIIRLNHPILRLRVIQNKNDLYSTYPNLMNLIINKNLAKTYTYGTTHKFLVKCPICGDEKYEQGKRLSEYKCYNCPNDSLSYPNKFLRAFMKCFDVDNLEYEYHPSWIKPYRYDCYFEFNEQRYIIEMDGGIGHGKLKFNSKEKDIEGLERDKHKDELAKEHDIEVIRINCNVSSVDFIKENILKSQLSKIFDLSNVNWENCGKWALDNLLIKVCEYYKNAKDEDKNTTNISKLFDLDITTVQKYLNIGTENGLCFYDKELANKMRYENSIKGIKEHAHKIKVFHGDEFIGIFTMDDLLEYLKINTDVNSKDNIMKNSIRNICRGDLKRKMYFGYRFEYAD